MQPTVSNNIQHVLNLPNNNTYMVDTIQRLLNNEHYVSNYEFMWDLYINLNKVDKSVMTPYYFMQQYKYQPTVFHKPFLVSTFLFTKFFDIINNELVSKAIPCKYQFNNVNHNDTIEVLNVVPIGSLSDSKSLSQTYSDPMFDDVPYKNTGYMIGASYTSENDASDYQYTYHGITDIYVIEYKFSDGIIQYAVYDTTLVVNNSSEINDYLVATPEFIQAVNYVLKSGIYDKTIREFKVGVYEAFLNNNKLSVNTCEIKSKSRVIHPNNKLLNIDVKYFFENLVPNKLTKKNSRKVLLAGQPGTGKTSLIVNLINDYKDTHFICYVYDLGAMKAVWDNVSKSNVPVIIVFEDVESHFAEGNNRVLNVLDGSAEPLSNMGTYIIFTSNDPDSIEDRIKKRKGRVDERININYLSGSFVNDCFKYHISSMFNVDESLVNVNVDNTINNVSGAEIQNMVSTLHKYLVTNGIVVTNDNLSEHITNDNIIKAYNTLQQEYINLNKISKEHNSKSSGKGISIGKQYNNDTLNYGDDYDNHYGNDDDDDDDDYGDDN